MIKRSTKSMSITINNLFYTSISILISRCIQKSFCIYVRPIHIGTVSPTVQFYRLISIFISRCIQKSPCMYVRPIDIWTVFTTAAASLFTWISFISHQLTATVIETDRQARTVRQVVAARSIVILNCNYFVWTGHVGLAQDRYFTLNTNSHKISP